MMTFPRTVLVFNDVGVDAKLVQRLLDTLKRHLSDDWKINTVNSKQLSGEIVSETWSNCVRLGEPLSLRNDSRTAAYCQRTSDNLEKLDFSDNSWYLNSGDSFTLSKSTSHLSPLPEWTKSCALLIIPGGRDLAYLGHESTCLSHWTPRVCQIVRQYVLEEGGQYLGICAGAYFASHECDFWAPDAVSTGIARVTGKRPLDFFPGVAWGPFPFLPFAYNGKKQGSAVNCHVSPHFFESAPENERIHSVMSYWTGGCTFRSVTSPWEILLSYEQDNAPAMIYGKVGQGKVLLTGLHLETSGEDDEQLSVETRSRLVSHLAQRDAIWRKILQKLLGDDAVSFSQGNQDRTPSVITSWGVTVPAIPPEPFSRVKGSENENDCLFQGKLYEKLYKKIASDCFVPIYHASLLTSTQTILHDNETFADDLCRQNAALLASQQTQGRGRGTNRWLSDKGVLQCTMVRRYRPHNNKKGWFSLPLVQYVMAVGACDGVRSACPKTRLSIKWPNDLYLDNIKIGGILVQAKSLVTDPTCFRLLMGIGLNVCHPSPALCLADKDPSVEMTSIVAHVLSGIERAWLEFVSNGFEPLLSRYYDYWLHQGNPLVTLEQTGERVQIVGIDCFGHLLAKKAESVADRLFTPRLSTPHIISLQHPPEQMITLAPDGNRFDMLQGLIRIK